MDREKVVYIRKDTSTLKGFRRYRVLSETLTHVYLQDMDHLSIRFNVIKSDLADYYTKRVDEEEK
jgi:hypothetical protein